MSIMNLLNPTTEETKMANLLGAKIKELRKEKGLTLEQLAELIGSGKSYIWELENKGNGDIHRAISFWF